MADNLAAEGSHTVQLVLISHSISKSGYKKPYYLSQDECNISPSGQRNRQRFD